MSATGCDLYTAIGGDAAEPARLSRRARFASARVRGHARADLLATDGDDHLGIVEFLCAQAQPLVRREGDFELLRTRQPSLVGVMRWDQRVAGVASKRSPTV